MNRMHTELFFLGLVLVVQIKLAPQLCRFLRRRLESGVLQRETYPTLRPPRKRIIMSMKRFYALRKQEWSMNMNKTCKYTLQNHQQCDNALSSWCCFFPQHLLLISLSWCWYTSLQCCSYFQGISESVSEAEQRRSCAC